MRWPAIPATAIRIAAKENPDGSVAGVEELETTVAEYGVVARVVLETDKSSAQNGSVGAQKAPYRVKTPDSSVPSGRPAFQVN